MAAPILKLFARLVVGVSTRVETGLWRHALKQKGERVHGLRIVVVFVYRRRSQLLRRQVIEALEWLAKYDSPRLTRIQRDLDAIVIWPWFPAGWIGYYNDKYRACVLNDAAVEEEHPVQVALHIVHEATHARLVRFGYDEAHRDRIEGICRAQERAFAARLPDGDRIVQALSEMHTAIESVGTSDAQMISHQINSLEEMGGSPLLVRGLRALRRRKRDDAEPGAA